MKLSKEDWAAFRKLPLFADITPEEIASLMNGNDIRILEKGEAIYHKNDAPDSMFLLLEGSAKLCRPTVDGHEGIIGIFCAGDTMGECDMFQGLGRMSDAVCLSRTRLLRIDGERMKQAIANAPEIAFVMMASASRYVKKLIEQVERTKISNSTRRVADFLLNLSANSPDNGQLTLPYEKSLIANQLAMTPESFSRALHALRSVGVSVNREIVILEDKKALEKFVSSGDLFDSIPKSPHFMFDSSI